MSLYVRLESTGKIHNWDCELTVASWSGNGCGGCWGGVVLVLAVVAIILNSVRLCTENKKIECGTYLHSYHNPLPQQLVLVLGQPREQLHASPCTLHRIRTI